VQLTKEMLKKNLDQIQDQLGPQSLIVMFEAGKQVGRIEGQISLLQQLVNVANPAPASVPEADLKITEEEGDSE